MDGTVERAIDMQMEQAQGYARFKRGRANYQFTVTEGEVLDFAGRQLRLEVEGAGHHTVELEEAGVSLNRGQRIALIVATLNMHGGQRHYLVALIDPKSGRCCYFSKTLWELLDMRLAEGNLWMTLAVFLGSLLLVIVLGVAEAEIGWIVATLIGAGVVIHLVNAAHNSLTLAAFRAQVARVAEKEMHAGTPAG